MDAKTLGVRALVALLFLAILATGYQLPGYARKLELSVQAPDAPALAPSLWVTPLKLDLGPVGIGKTSDIQVVTVKNTGNALLSNFSNTSLPAPFDFSTNCNAGVQPGNTCTYSFWIEPNGAGKFTGSMTVTTNAGPFTVEVLGEGLAPEISVSPLSFDFGVTIPKEIKKAALNDQPQIVVVRNIGLGVVTNFSGGNVSTPFEMENNCTTAVSLEPGEECQYFYNFFPSMSGSFTATSTVSTNAGSFIIQLQGKGDNNVSGQMVTPRELNFGPIGIGFTSPTQDVTITNLNTATSITDFTISDPGEPFTYTHTCVSNLAPGESCSYTFSIAPRESKEYIATPLITNSLGNFPITLHATGVGADVSATPLTLDFGALLTGTTSAPQMVTIKNTGLGKLYDIYPANVNPPFSGSQNCGVELLPGETCQLTYYFSPDEYGRYISPTLTTAAGKQIQISLLGGMEVPQVKKTFLPEVIALGNFSTLEIAISNINPAATLFDMQFTDNFPAGLVVASPLTYSLSPECGTPTFSPLAGKGSIAFSDGTFLGGKTCLVRINVTAPLVGEFPNTTGPVFSKYGIGVPASDVLRVVEKFYNYLPYMHK